jgi:hypothetical protein
LEREGDPSALVESDVSSSDLSLSSLVESESLLEPSSSGLSLLSESESALSRSPFLPPVVCCLSGASELGSSSGVSSGVVPVVVPVVGVVSVGVDSVGVVSAGAAWTVGVGGASHGTMTTPPATCASSG